MSARRRDDLPLNGIRVLVGRARHQAGSLSTELRKNGAQVIEIPFIEIRKPRSFRPLDSALRNLESYDWLILTSVNGVEAMWERLAKLGLSLELDREGHGFDHGSRRNKQPVAPAAQGNRLRIAAIGPATKKAIEQRGVSVTIVPEQYVAESVVRSLRSKVKSKRVLLVRAKIARDVIPQELRRAGAHVDVVEAYETVVPKSSRNRLQRLMKDPRRRPHVVTFTSSSTVRNFVNLLSVRGQGKQRIPQIDGVLISSIGPVTSATLREFGLPVQIKAEVFTIPGLVAALVSKLRNEPRS
jgi:uroporphyrinogen-III synthase